MNSKRPKYLVLHQMRMPMTAVVSILHRASGLVLFLSLPLLLWMLQCSLRSPETYAALLESLRHPVSKLFLLALLWALTHHFFAGIRYLLIDVGYGVSHVQSCASSRVVIASALLVTAMSGVMLW